jgi:sugar lactone lactonase YvrE
MYEMAQSELLILITLFLIGIEHISGKCLRHEEELVYQWISVEFQWPNDTVKQDYLDAGKYIPENNAINGIKLYKDQVYLTIPRLKDGVAASLVRIDGNSNDDSPLLHAYPSWDMHVLEDCNTLQLVQSMEIEPDTGRMWILDTAYVPSTSIEVAKRCSPKIVVWDINQNTEVYRYVFPKDIVTDPFYLNDLVLDYGTGNDVEYVYISDTLGRKMVVYDHLNKESYVFIHASFDRNMEYSSISINGESTMAPLGVNGIAISNDFKMVYYCPLASLTLYRVPTSALRNKNSNLDAAVETLGSKGVQSDGLYYGKGSSLYYSTLGQNGIYRWDTNTNVKEAIVINSTIEWVDSLGMDDNGYLWFATNNLHTFFGNTTVPGKPNYYVWKVYVGEGSYLAIPKGSPKYTCTERESTGTHPANLVEKWATLDFEWATCDQRKEAVDSKNFSVAHNEIGGIWVYEDKMYVTIPRTQKGALATLGVLVDHAVRPFPSVSMNAFGDCNALQFVQNIEIDVNTDYMWILDSAFPQTCKPKLVVYDLKKDSEVFRYEFPDSLMNQDHLLEDLVLDYVDKTAVFAYIPDSVGQRLTIFDIQKRTARHLSHSSMNYVNQYTDLAVSGQTTGPHLKGIKGIAMSPNFKYVYYSPFAGTKLYQIETSVLRNESSSESDIDTSIKELGTKNFVSSSLYSSKSGLYLTNLQTGTILKWSYSSTGSFVSDLTPHATEVTKNCLFQWFNSLFIDEKGNLWFTTRNVHPFFGNSTKSANLNYFTWKSNIDEQGYLQGQIPRTTSAGSTLSHNAVIVCLFAAIYKSMYI